MPEKKLYKQSPVAGIARKALLVSTFMSLSTGALARLDQPVTISPEGKDVTAPSAFTWQPVANAEEYEVLIKIDGEVFSSELYPVSALGCDTGSVCQLDTEVPAQFGSRVRWKVKAFSSTDRKSRWSAAKKYVVGSAERPTIIAPDGLVEVAQPVYSWNAQSEATGYQLRLEQDGVEIFTQPIDLAMANCDADSAECSFTPTFRLQEDNNYRWQIKTVYALGEGKWSAGKPVKARNIPLNELPTANAGADKTIVEGRATALVGSGSDAEGEVTFLWEQVSGVPMRLLRADMATAVVSTSEIDQNEVLEFKLTVTDASGESASDSMQLTVENVEIDYGQITNALLRECIKSNLLSLGSLDRILSLSCSNAGANGDFNDDSLREVVYLPNLVTVNLSSIRVNDLTPLKSLEDLRILDLNRNSGGADLAPLSDLPLFALDVSSYYNTGTSNQTLDIQALANITSLNVLNISDNQIEDLEPLRSLVNLENRLDASNNNIADISPITSLKELRNISLRMNDITVLPNLSELTNLTDLSLGLNQISNISPLSSLTSLDNLNLSDNDISDISALTSLTSLERLDLGNNNISDIRGLAGLNKLTRLDVEGNNIIDISSVSGLTALTNLNIENNNISDISSLSNLSGAFLYVEGNCITDFSAFEGSGVTLRGAENQRASCDD